MDVVYDFSVPMALVDFLPVILFAFAAVLLMKDLYRRMTQYAFALFAAGTINVFCAGFLKALWKLLYAAGACNFYALNTLFLPLQSLGFLMAGAAMIIFVCGKKKALLSVAPVYFSGTAVFLVMMVAGLGCMSISLAVIAGKKKKYAAAVLFVLAFIFSLGMGYAARLDSAAAWVNWMEQGINIASQACLAAAAWMLHKAVSESGKEES